MSGGNFVAGGGEGVTAGGAVEEIVATGVDVPEEFPEARLLADAQLERSNEILMRRTVSTELSQVLLLRCCLLVERKLILCCILLCLSLLCFQGA